MDYNKSADNVSSSPAISIHVSSSLAPPPPPIVIPYMGNGGFIYIKVIFWVNSKITIF